MRFRGDLDQPQTPYIIERKFCKNVKDKFESQH